MSLAEFKAKQAQLNYYYEQKLYLADQRIEKVRKAIIIHISKTSS
jgi:hypothetical protein